MAGGAGRGKTVVALHRAAFLVKRPGSRVLLCTFTRNLAANLQMDIRSLLAPDDLARVDVRGVDQVVRAVQRATVWNVVEDIVVDEGQDLHAGHWRVLRGVVAPGPNDLFICEDGHQRIYGERTVLSRFGIETRVGSP